MPMTKTNKFSTYAEPVAPTDMSNYHRLQAELRRRNELKQKHPNFEDATTALLAHPLVESFTNAAEGNAKAELRVFMMRLFEASVSDNIEHESHGAHSIKQIGRDMLDYAKDKNISGEKATLAAKALTETISKFSLR